MKKEEFLLCYKRALQRERQISEKILELRERKASASAIRYTALPHGADISDLSDYIVQLEDYIQKLTAAKNRTDAVSRALCECLRTLPEQDEYDVLYYKYIKLWTPSKIAEKLYISRTSVYYVEKKALQHLTLTPGDIEKVEKLLIIP